MFKIGMIVFLKIEKKPKLFLGFFCCLKITYNVKLRWISFSGRDRSILAFRLSSLTQWVVTNGT